MATQSSISFAASEVGGRRDKASEIPKMGAGTSDDGSSDGKESACNAGDLGLTPGSGRSPGERYGNPLQYSCLKNSMDRGAWLATVHGITKNRTRLSD